MQEMKRGEIELLAPAGSFESLTSALKAGADAIYFGVEKLNMRARSSHNFTLEDLPVIMDTCREYDARAYLTLNVVTYDHELPVIRQIIDRAAKARIHAVIATDISAIHIARSAGMEVHLSTQVNISNAEAVKFYAAFAELMVLARELDLEQVQSISRYIRENKVLGPSGNPVRLEMFIHGALCMAVSGKCYLSLHEMDASANRGECLQTCRKSYTVRNKDTGYELDIDREFIMSPKDLKTIHFLNKILDSGVRVLKIEGRARGPEYVKTVTECYNEAINAWCEGSFTEEKIGEWNQRLSTVFNRGFWDGYYLGQRMGEWSHRYGSRATMRKIYIGKVLNYFSRQKVAEVGVEAGILGEGDKVLIIGPTTGVVETVASGLRIDNRSVEKAEKSSVCTFRVEEKLRRSDQVYRWVEAKHVIQQ